MGKTMMYERPAVDWPNRAELLKALGHPIRLQIVAILCERDQHVGAMAEEIETAQATISQQLAILRMRGLVSSNRIGGRAVYSLEEERLKEIVECVKECGKPADARSDDAGEESGSRAAF
jgi:ArsR family transcriptional regulator